MIFLDVPNKYGYQLDLKDPLVQKLYWRYKISIHAPARGATGELRPSSDLRKHFNSRPCERGDHPFNTFVTVGLYFNSRPCERGDLMIIWETAKKS